MKMKERPWRVRSGTVDRIEAERMGLRINIG